MFRFMYLFFKIEIYEDKDNARRDEIAVLGGQTATGINLFSVFYDRLKEVSFSKISCGSFVFIGIILFNFCS